MTPLQDSDDEDDEDDVREAQKKQAMMSSEDEDGFLGQTPAAKFIHTFWKGGKKDHHKEKAGIVVMRKFESLH